MSKRNIATFRDMPNGEAAIAKLPHKFLDSLHIDQLESLSRSWSLIARCAEVEAIRDDSSAKIVNVATGEEVWYYMNPYDGPAETASVDDYISPEPISPMVIAGQQIAEGLSYQRYSDEDHQRHVEFNRRHGRSGDDFNVYKETHWSGFGETHDRHLGKYAVEHEADSRYRRAHGRLDRDSADYRVIYEQVTSERETPTIDFDSLGPIELVQSGNAPELPYPAARISTVSGTIVFNQSFINRLRGEFAVLPTWIEVSLAQGGQVILFRFLEDYERGAYKLGNPTMYNRGWSISPKSMIGRLVSQRSRQLHSDARGKTNYEQAADLIFGRRRLSQVSGTPFWAMDLRSDIV